MSIGPRAQGDLIRSVQKVERDRFRRAIERTRAEIWADLCLASGGKMDRDEARHSVHASFERMRAKVSPKRRSK